MHMHYTHSPLAKLLKTPAAAGPTRRQSALKANNLPTRSWQAARDGSPGIFGRWESGEEIVLACSLIAGLILWSVCSGF